MRKSYQYKIFYTFYFQIVRGSAGQVAWIRIQIQGFSESGWSFLAGSRSGLRSLAGDPDPGSMNTDPKQCFSYPWLRAALTGACRVACFRLLAPRV